MICKRGHKKKYELVPMIVARPDDRRRRKFMSENSFFEVVALYNEA